MARQAGKSGKVMIDATVPVEYLGIEKWELSADADLQDVTGMDSGGAAEFIAGITSGTATVDAFSVAGIDADIMPGNTVIVYLYQQRTDTACWHGSALVKTVKPTVEVKGAVKFNLTLQFTNTLAYSIP